MYLKEEKEEMFNYASNGGYLDMSGGSQSTNPEYVTNGLYSTEDEDGVSYYFRGAVDNNYVQFGEYTSDYYVYGSDGFYYQTKESCLLDDGNEDLCQQVKLASAGDKMYWRIVRVNGDGSLRLIYNGTSANPTFAGDKDTTYAVGDYIPYNLENNNPKYTGYTYDNGTDSFIKKEVDTWYKNALGNTVYDSKVVGGRFCSDSSGYKLETDYGFPDMGDYTVFASYDRLLQSATGYQKENSPSLKCPSTTESYGGSYRLKAGLITADELVFAGENPGVETDSYLNPGSSNMRYWSMSPAVFGSGNAAVWRGYEDLFIDNVDRSNAVRPVINVTTDNGFTSGDGTASNPYIIN